MKKYYTNDLKKSLKSYACTKMAMEQKTNKVKSQNNERTTI